MTMIFMDSFDDYATADLTKKYTTVTGAAAIVTVGRKGSGTILGANEGQGAGRAFTAVQTAVMAVAALRNAAPSAINAMMVFQDSGSTQVKISVDVDGTLRVYRGAGTTNLLGSTAAGAFPLNTWTHIGFKAKIDPTVGTIEVWVNGTSVLALTGQNTRATANSTTNAFNLLGPATSAWFDDLYVLNTAGSVNNDFLGDCRVDALLPNADGTYSQFTPSTGSIHYLLVDEAAPNTTDYNDGGTVNHRDSYGFANLDSLASSTVYAVQVNAAVNKDDAGARSAGTFARSGSTDVDGTGVALSTSQTYISQIYETDPNGAIPWTQTSVNAAEFGVKVTA